MTYLRPGSWPKENLVEYQRFIALWTDVVCGIVARGNRAHLFVSDPGDNDAVRDVLARLDEETRASCSVAHATTPDALLNVFRRLDVVISSRLHGVLLAIVAGRPVLALSHERKVRAVMGDAGVSSFCLDLPTATIDQVSRCLADLTDQLDSCSSKLHEYGMLARAAVQSQDEILPQLVRQW
jgi:polysaccharide pyruvyl transferase WcaK-like protein